MRLMRLCIVAFFLWSLVGCQTLSEKRQAKELEDTLRKYAATFRWGSMQQARSFAADDPGDIKASEEKPLRILHYEVVQGPTQISDNKALQTVQIQYTFETSQSVRSLMDHQIWQYTDESWSLTSPFPVFK